ncbi:MAG: EscU/YscU/HrcU family type III secretion system export apparatus switch protein [Roseomonas sp.]|nr:EscU/YscU/HrcU family type III secretion system export apparatus switch protein [Roseomonas sp.]MCA3387135.1 EscU/YscU/HrcU family type III secretion system export apparatus switch protein [Roseomonas sp.]MCA3409100.1 EscU/YscU/HrcU family type III secretion system export apparatus switch protein [Roseomonas sp.]
MSGSSGGNEEGGQDKTEEATPRRIEKAREEGQIALSREVVGFVALGFALIGMTLGLPPLGAELMRGMRGVLENAHQLQTGFVATEMIRLGILAVLPVMALGMIGAIAGTMLQSRGLIAGTGLKPQFSKINPASGIKRLLGVEGGIEFLRTLIKLGVVCAALWWALGDPRELRSALSLGPDDLLRLMVRSAMNLFIAAMIAFAAIAVLDYLVVRFRHLHKLRMTRQEVREEVKESEGDPMIKGRIKSIRMARARRRMMAAVPKAAVVITNPTHYAVALAYDENSQAAPKVVAKGTEAVAARIRALAEESKVPLVSNPPLARALFKLELDTEIPAEHYQAVAEIIAYVWRLRGRAGAAA